MNFNNFSYNHLNHLQIGRIGEYWAKLCFTLNGFETYHCDVDDKGIDFILRVNETRYIDIQVKTIRENTKYVFVSKETWKNKLRENLYLVVVLISNNKFPELFFIPSKEFDNTNELFRDRNYNKAKGQTSKPEWGLNISKKNMHLLEEYKIEKMKHKIIANH